MRVVPMRGEEDCRAIFPERSHHRLAARFIERQVTVGKLKVDPHIEPHHSRRIKSFLRANFRCAPRAHLAARHISDADASAESLQFNERARHHQFGIVGTRKDREYVELDLVSHSATRKALKISNSKFQSKQQNQIEGTM